MKKTYSENDLIQFIYAETSQADNEGIAFQLEDSGTYNKTFADLLSVKRMLDSLSFSPSINVLQSIKACSAMA